MLTAPTPIADAQRTVFGELQIRSLLDDPALRSSLGVSTAGADRTERPANIRRLLDLAAA